MSRNGPCVWEPRYFKAPTSLFEILEGLANYWPRQPADFFIYLLGSTCAGCELGVSVMISLCADIFQHRASVDLAL
eukprot:scaffold260795_cov39-Tisochrysis_lutea.AAC.1